MPLKVVLFLDSPVIATGYASTCRLTAHELKLRGYDVYCVNLNNSPVGDSVLDWYGLKILPNTALYRDPNAIYGDSKLVEEIFAQVDPDIFFIHNDLYRHSYLSSMPANILERCVYWLPFEGEHPDGHHQILGEMAASRFVTKHAFNIHEGLLAGKNIGVIPHAVDMDHYMPGDKPAAKKAKQKGLDEKFVVLRVDRHQPRKFWSLTVKAFAKFAKDKSDVFLLAKCNPRDMTMWDYSTKTGVDLESLSRDLGVSDKIFFDDYFFSSPAMAQCFYHPADVFLSTTSGEGFGLTPVEAMACGLPVICPNVPVLPEVLGDGAVYCKVSGKDWYEPLKCEYNTVDVDDVVAKLESAYLDWKSGGAKLKEMGDRGREIALARYSPKAVYDAWDRLFKDLVAKRDMVSVVTVLYNLVDDQIAGEDGIQKFYDSMLKYVTHPYEWVIVDNGSPASSTTREWMRKAAARDDRIKPIYLDVNMGFAGANNKGIAVAKGKWIVLSNPDSQALDPYTHGMPFDHLRMMVDKAKTDYSIGIIGMELKKRDDIIPGLAFPYFCNVLITKKCLNYCRISTGQWLDERYWPAYYEDADFTLRAMSKGFKVIAINLPFYHVSGGTNKYAIHGGPDGPHVSHIGAALERLAADRPGMADFPRKRGELAASGMEGLISGNINFLRSQWGLEARQQIKIVWHTHIGAAVGFSQIAEGLIPELHQLGFDVYINDWSNGANIDNPLIKQLVEKTRKANEEGDELDDAINIVCWLMESFLDVDAEYKVGISFCESTKVRPQYLQACNSMDRILTFSEFCRGVQKDSGFLPPIHVVPPGVHPIFSNYYERPVRDKFTFLAVGVHQERKDTRRLVEAFCEAFPKNAAYPPECEPGFPLAPSQVELVIKSNNFGDLNWIEKEGYSDRANVRGIFTGWAAGKPDLSMQEMYDLYTSADCLVHPSRGEGIGMPILEAAATGMPAIFTNWSSPAEYLDESNSYPCSLGPNGTDLIDAYPGAGIPGENGKWASVHIGHLKHLMRHVIRNRDEAKEKGRRAAANVLSKYNWSRSAECMVPLIFAWEDERRNKPKTSVFDPFTFQKPILPIVTEGDRVLIDLVTRDRHPYVASLLISLLSQTFKDWDILIEVDDSDESILTNHQIRSLLSRAEHEGHRTRMIRSHRQGPHIAHDRTLQMANDDPNYKYKLICRIDDDIYIHPTYLEKLFEIFLSDSDVGAVGGVYLDPTRRDMDQAAPPNYASSIEYAGKIDHNVPWPYICQYPDGTGPRLVEHLYSSFMYRVEAGVAIGGYCRKFSQIGHREESDFSYRFHLAGWKLFIQPDAKGYHFSAPSGGIRSDGIIDRQKLAESDHRIYSRRLAKWKKLMELKRQETMKTTSSDPTAPLSSSGKLLVIINGGKDADKIKSAVERFGAYSDDIYVTCDAAVAEGLEANPKVKLVATTLEETALLAKQTLADGDHEYIMTVSPDIIFTQDPRASFSRAFDDYVFETYTTYMSGTMNSGMFTQDGDGRTLVGPECRNFCLITRRRANAKPSQDRIFYSDVVVLQDERLVPVNGKSIMGHDLIRLEDMDRVNWTKVCVYQFPEGKLQKPRMAEVTSNERLVSIIIPTAGRRALLKQCIDSIYAHTSTPFEIIIVDNDSKDGTMAYLEAERLIRPNIKHFRQHVNLGYQKAVNIGISKARGKYIMLFNDDAWVQGREPDGRDWLQVYVDELRADSKLGIVGAHGCDSPALSKRILFFWCVMFEKSLYDKVGPLDDVTFKNYGGDDDYCMRVINAEYSIKERATNLRHLMNQVPDHIKNQELAESVIKLRAKYSMS